jgi:rare lipoprotein A
MAITLDLGRQARLALLLLAGSSLCACATPKYSTRATGPMVGAPAPGQGGYKVGAPYQVAGIWYVPKDDPKYDQTGVASWYGDAFHLKATANGEVFDMNAVSAAHTTLPLPSMVEVTNLDNGRKLVVRVNDRGPFVGNRIIDLSREAARQLGVERAGLAKVRVRYVGQAPLTGPDAGVRYAANRPLATRMAAGPAPGPRPDPVMALASSEAPPPMRTAPAAAGAITTQDLPPLTGPHISAAPIAGPGPAPVVPSETGAAVSALRVQAGAFSSEINAQRAVSALAQTGRASIEPMQRDGATYYRVTLPAPADEDAAYALRDRVAEIGFADARVVRTF